MTASGLNLYTIDPHLPFVDALARGLMARIEKENPGNALALARATVLLPTRRAVRSLREAFLRASEGRPLLLPRMMPLGDLDEDELAIEGGMDGEGDATLPPVIGGLRRQLILARLVMRFGGLSWSTPPDASQAAELARELARLLDQMETERLGFDQLKDLVPDHLASHWQATLEFLKIVTEYWPKELEAQGAIGPAERRNRLLAAQAEKWKGEPPDGWVVAAGSTGSIPATADLLAIVARLTRGAVVLPGFDQSLDEADWAALAESHPQYGLAKLLEHMGAGPGDVRPFEDDWPHGLAPRAPDARAGVLSAAMAVSPQPKTPPGNALDGIALANCPGPSEEAAVIALRMRGVLETPGRTAALVTTDRGLARRVAARLAHWGIEVDDSAGTPLAATEAGSFFRLIAEMTADRFAPLSVLACLKHPLAGGGQAAAGFRAMARALELNVLRGPRPAPGVDGLAQRITTAKEEAKPDDRPGLDALQNWTRALAGTVAPFAAAMAARDATLSDIAAAHAEAAEALAATDEEDGASRLWHGDDGEALAALVGEILESAGQLPPLPGSRYPALLGALMAGRVVRPRWGRHPRLHIWGPLEARLQHADVMILAGLNEGTWPPEAGADPWMSRPMRAALGLPLPERRVGLAAHDFSQAFSAPEVLLTRAEREGGTPTVPSRWLARLENAVPKDIFAGVKARGAAWARAAQVRDDPPERAAPAPERPAPRPPLAARPRQLSVTQIETLQINPYAVYARHVLGLKPLDDIDADAGAAERGTFTHEALQKFVEKWRDALPGPDVETVAGELTAIGREVFRPVVATPGVHAFWWPRFERIAAWVAALEIGRRAKLTPIGAECRGEITIETPGGPFILTGIADRMEEDTDGRRLIVDYKTGSLPSARDMKAGFAPQLPLLAAIAEDGGFPGLGAGEVVGLAYWRLSGGEPAGEEKEFAVPASDAAEAALNGLKTLIALFDDPEWPYLPHPVAGHAPRFDDYAHLARVKEWAATDAGADGGEG